MIKEMLPYLIATNGKIINIGSDSGLVPFPYTIPYSMTEFAIEALTDGLAEELREYNIAVSIIEPGNIATDIMRKAIDKVPSPLSVQDELRYQHRKLIPEFEKATYDFSQSQGPIQGAKRVYESLIDTSPCRRCFEGTGDELRTAVDTLFKRIVQINHDSRDELSIFKLVERLKYTYDQGC